MNHGLGDSTLLVATHSRTVIIQKGNQSVWQLARVITDGDEIAVE